MLNIVICKPLVSVADFTDCINDTANTTTPPARTLGWSMSTGAFMHVPQQGRFGVMPPGSKPQRGQQHTGGERDGARLDSQ